MLYNKRAYELLYLQLKGQDRTQYNQVRESYQYQYSQENPPRKTPFEKLWANALYKLRSTYDYQIPNKLETIHERQQRMQTPVATHAEIERAKVRLRNHRKT